MYQNTFYLLKYIDKNVDLQPGREERRLEKTKYRIIRER
jgi:hypothetical protein